MKQIK
jgi:hypothetical protein